MTTYIKDYPAFHTLDIGVDIDNVLYPWSQTYTRWVERQKGLLPGTLDDHALSWTWYKDQWGMGTEEFLEHYASGVEAGVIFVEGTPSQGSVSALRRLHSAGHRIHYVTDRAVNGVTERHAFNVTHRWLHDHGYPVDSLTISSDKMARCTDVFLDDGLHNISSLLLSGHPFPVIWDRAHNRDAAPAMVRRARDWHEFEALVSEVFPATPSYRFTDQRTP